MENPPPNVPNDEIDKISEFTTSASTSKSSDVSLAEQEQKSFLNDGKRGEAYKKHIHNIVIVGMYVVGFSLVILFLIWAWHLVAPCEWRWLDQSETQGIERILFSGVIISLAGRYFSKFNILGKSRN